MILERRSSHWTEVWDLKSKKSQWSNSTQSKLCIDSKSESKWTKFLINLCKTKVWSYDYWDALSNTPNSRKYFSKRKQRDQHFNASIHLHKLICYFIQIQVLMIKSKEEPRQNVCNLKNKQKWLGDPICNLNYPSYAMIYNIST